MWQKSMPDKVEEALKSIDEIIRQQEDMINNARKTDNFVNTNAALAGSSDEKKVIANDKTETLLKEFADMFSGDAAEPESNSQDTKENKKSSLEGFDRFFKNEEKKAKQTEPAITEKQLQTLNKKHLLIMILDLQEKLERVEEENENMLRAFRTGYEYGRQTG